MHNPIRPHGKTSLVENRVWVPLVSPSANYLPCEGLATKWLFVSSPTDLNIGSVLMTPTPVFWIPDLYPSRGGTWQPSQGTHSKPSYGALPPFLCTSDPYGLPQLSKWQFQPFNCSDQNLCIHPWFLSYSLSLYIPLAIPLIPPLK